MTTLIITWKTAIKSFQEIPEANAVGAKRRTISRKAEKIIIYLTKVVNLKKLLSEHVKKF